MASLAARSGWSFQRRPAVRSLLRSFILESLDGHPAAKSAENLLPMGLLDVRLRPSAPASTSAFGFFENQVICASIGRARAAALLARANLVAAIFWTTLPGVDWLVNPRA